MTSELGGIRMRKKSEAGFWEYPIAHALVLMLGTTVDVFFAFAISFSFPYLQGTPGANLGSKVGYICGGLATGGWIHNYLFLPELAHRSLEEVDELYEVRQPKPVTIEYFTDAGLSVSIGDGNTSASEQQVSEHGLLNWSWVARETSKVIQKPRLRTRVI